MNDAARIAIGAGSAMLLGWVAHGPLGYGSAFVREMQERAAIALGTAGLSDVSIDFPTRPLSRVAILSGTHDPVHRRVASDILSAVPGISSARWTDEAVSDRQVEPAPGAADTAACQNRIAEAVNARTLRFRAGSAWLNPQSRRTIGEVAAFLKRCPGLTIAIGNHGDGKGINARYRAMAQERARRVREALIAQGVPPQAVVAKGGGAGARRISFTVVEKGS